MSEFGPPNPETLVEGIRIEQNEIEEHLEQQFLSDTLFHNDFQMSLADKHLSHGEYADELGRLQGEFLKDKKGKNMGERFELALSEKYLGKIDVVELGSTDQPGRSNSIDGLKHEYLDLLSWMKHNGLVEDEVSRQKSQRFLSIRNSRVSPDHLVVSRNRPLVKTDIPSVHGDEKITLGIVKRMTFAMPNRTVALLATLGGEEGSAISRLNDERALERLEFMLDQANGGIIPIRTSYYLSSRLS